MKTRLYLILISLLPIGCSTTVPLTRPVPPEMVLEKQPAKIFFSNLFDFQNNPGIKEKHEAAYKIAVDEFANTLANGADIENPVVTFLIDSASQSAFFGLPFEEVLPKSEIKSICRSNDANYLLTLDSLRLNFEWEVIREEDPIDGSVSKTKDFYLISNYYVTLYDTAGTDIKRTLLQPTHYYKSRLTLGALITILPNLDKARDHIKILAQEAGTEYIRMFYPKIENFLSQKIYTGKAFKRTNSLILSGQYNEAIRQLHEMEKNAKPGLAKKIRHNISVAELLRSHGSL